MPAKVLRLHIEPEHAETGMMNAAAAQTFVPRDVVSGSISSITAAR
jgi:hypothetical protein